MFTRLRYFMHSVNARKVSTASAGSSSHKACCSIPPVEASYTPKGFYGPYAGFDKVYFTGPEGSSRALVAVYDIFGFFPQTLQGADILATAIGARVVMPDFFEPVGPFPVDRFPPKTDEDKKDLDKFFGGIANPAHNIEKTIRVGTQLRKDGFTKVGVYGYCWGGKVAIVSGQNVNAKIFDALSIIHPAMLSAADAEKLSIPMGFFPSKDEDPSEIEKTVSVLNGKPFAGLNAYKHYTTMHHGWAAARGDLNDPENKKQYVDLYDRLSKFFQGAFEADENNKVTEGVQARL